MRLAPGNGLLSLGILSEILSWFPTSPASHWPGCFIWGPQNNKALLKDAEYQKKLEEGKSLWVKGSMKDTLVSLPG